MANETDNYYLKVGVQMDTAKFQNGVNGMKAEMKALKGLLGNNLLSDADQSQVLKRMSAVQLGIKELNDDIRQTAVADLLGDISQVGAYATAAFGAATTAAELFGASTKDAEEIQKKMLQVMQLTQAFEQLANTKSILMMLKRRALEISTFVQQVANLALKKTELVATNAQIARDEYKIALQSKGNLITKAAIAVQWAWNAALAANPIGLVVAGIVALTAAVAGLIVWYNKYSDSQDEINKKTDTLVEKNKILIDQREIMIKSQKDVSDNIQKNYVDEKMKIDTLRRAIGDTNLAMEDRKKALNELKDLIGPKYNKSLNLENSAYGELNKNITAYLQNFKLIATAKALEVELGNKYVDQFKKQEELKTQINLQNLYQRLADAAKVRYEEGGGAASTINQAGRDNFAIMERWNKSLSEAKIKTTTLSGDLKSITGTIGTLEKQLTPLGGLAYTPPKTETRTNEASKKVGPDVDLAIASYEVMLEEERKLAQENREKIDADEMAALEERKDTVPAAFIAPMEEALNKLSALNDEEVSKYGRTFDEKSNILKQALNAGYIDEKEYNEKVRALNIKTIQDEVDNLETQLKYMKEGTAEYIRMLTLIAEKKQEIANIKVDSPAEWSDLDIGQQLTKIGEFAATGLQAYQEVSSAIMDRNRQDMDQMVKEQNEAIATQYDASMESLDDALKYGLVTQSGYNKAKEKLDKERLEKEKKVKIQQFESEKKMAIQTAIVNTALAVTNGLLTVPFVPAGIIAAGVAAAAGLIQIGTIKSSKPQFGLGGFIDGSSHMNGGVDINAEGGEFIVNKNIARRPGMGDFLNKVNSGQVTNTTVNNGVDIDTMKAYIQETVSAITAIPVIAVESDYTKVQRRVSSIESRSGW